MDSRYTASQIISELLEDKSLPNLISHQIGQIFPLSNTIPDDLKDNLISQNRVIRNIKINGQDASVIIRAFYFQLLKLCYQLQDQQKSHTYLAITKSILFRQSISKDAQLRIYAKQLAQFIRMIESEQDPYFQNILQQYNQIDKALVNLLSSLFANYQEAESHQNSIQNILNELCQYFSVAMIPNHPFYQFVETDIYLYVASLQQMYLVYDELYYAQSKNDVNQPINQRPLQNNPIHQVKNQQTANIYETENEQNVKNSQHFLIKSVPNQLLSETKYNQYINIPILSQKQSSHPQYSFKNQKYDIQLENPFKKRQFQNYERYSNNLQQSITNKQQQARYLPLREYIIAPTSDALFNQQVQNSSQLNNGEGSANTPYNSIYSSNQKNETLMNLFGDMTKSGKNSTNLQHNFYTKKETFNNNGQIKQTHSQLQSKNLNIQKDNLQKDQNKNKNNKDPINSTEEKIISKQVVTQQQIANIYTRNFIFKYNSIENKNKMVNNDILHQKVNDIYDKRYKQTHQTSIDTKNQKQSVVNFDSDDSIFYKPRNSQLKAIPEVAASKQTINNRKYIEHNDSNGSIYRQFSDTRILSLLKQPHKTKIQIMRSRFKGYHFN